MENKRPLIKWTLYILLLILLLVLQTTVLSHLELFGVHALLIPGLVASVAVFEHPVRGAAFGFLAGLLCDAVIPPSEAFFSLFFLFAALGIGKITTYLFRRALVTCALFSLSVLFVMDLFYFLFFFLFTGKAGFSALYVIALPEILFSSLFVVPLYPLVRRISRITGEITV